MKPATRTSVGIVVTVMWLAAVAALVWTKRCELGSLELNEWGDFFAGAVAPLAFFWLILGYFQQGQELQQNTDALLAQEKALQLQAAETAALVTESRRQATAAEQQAQAVVLEAQRKEIESIGKAQPIFAPAGGSGAAPNLIFQLTNLGASARDISVSHPAGFTMEVQDPSRLPSGGTLSIRIIGTPTLPYDFSIHYKDAHDIARVKTFTMYSQFSCEEHAA